MACAAPVAEAPGEQQLDLDQLYAAYVAAHVSVDWAELVLDYVTDRRDELLDAYAELDVADDEPARCVVAWLRTLPDRP